MKILVLGVGGMAGHCIGRYFKEQGYETHGLSKSPIDFLDAAFICDVCDRNRLASILISGNYDCVINCIGLLNEAANSHKAAAIYLNSYLPHFIVNILEGTKTKLIQMSTDCVFSGEKGGYIETDFADGRSYYDRTKALGEVTDKKNLTFRNSIIGPDINENGIGLFNWFMKQNVKLQGYRSVIWTGVTTLTLAQAMEQAIKEKLTGVYNLVNNKTINKFELLSLFNKHMKASRLKITPSNKVVCDKSLINTRDDFSFVVPGYEEMIIEMKKWIYSHKNLYPHYFLER